MRENFDASIEARSVQINQTTITKSSPRLQKHIPVLWSSTGSHKHLSKMPDRRQFGQKNHWFSYERKIFTIFQITRHWLPEKMSPARIQKLGSCVKTLARKKKVWRNFIASKFAFKMPRFRPKFALNGQKLKKTSEISKFLLGEKT